MTPSLDLDDILSQLGASRAGLSAAEAQGRLAQYGYNELPEKNVSTFELLLSYFWGPMPWMIEAAIILCALVGDWVDFGIIGALLIGNALIGFFEEKSAGDAVAALKAQLALNATVKRDGQWQSIPARELVPGDLIRVKIGDVIPADLTLLECDGLSIDQAALTGESLPVSRGAGEEVYSGSILKRGQAEAVVSAAGVNTFFGKTAKLVSEAENTDHLQEAVLKLSDYLIIINSILVAAILVVRVHAGEDFIRVLKYCLVLTVASIPLATPTVLAVTMAIGSQLLAQKNALVTRLAAIDELAPELIARRRWGWITVTTPQATALYPQGEPWRVRVVVWQPETLRTWLIQEQITQIIDASHPFASQISALTQDLAQALNLAYVRYQRRECPLEAGVMEIASLEDLFSHGLLQGRRVFLTLGAKSLPFFRDYQDQAALFARILPTAASLELAQRGGFPPERLIALRPPVSEALELALWQQWRIETVVT
ncbi:MAG: precorrin-6A reductase, partial [Cyanobacteriota bacterium]